MSKRALRTIRRSIGVVIAALTLCIAAATTSASAQGLFDFLFGGFRRHMAPPRSNGPTELFGGYSRGASAESFGHGTIYCVRACDGRYFPLQRHAGMTPAETCHAFCPATKTMVFSGSTINTAVAPNGMRYVDLDSAFAYRDKVVEHCSCNGKDGLGLARVDTRSDPTLRPGDIVATPTGLATYNGSSKADREFTPISSGSSEWARRLADVKVEPAPAPPAAAPTTGQSTAQNAQEQTAR